MAFICPNCGAVLGSSTGNCPNCGASLVANNYYTQPNYVNEAPVQLTKPIPPGVSMNRNGEYQWTGECSAWKCTAFFRIIHIVCAVFAVLLCVLIGAIEGFESVGTVVLYWAIALAILGVIDFFICFIWVARRAFRYKALYTIGVDRIYSSEIESEGKNAGMVLLQLAADLAARGESEIGYSISVDYGKIREIVPDSSRTMIRIKAGAPGKFVITTPEQFDFVVQKIQEKLMFAKRA